MLVGIGIVLVLSPHVLVDNIHLGVAPTWSDFALGIAVGMIAYTGIETISNMAEEAKDAARTIPRSVGLVVAAVLGLYLLIPIVALSAMPVVHDAVGNGYHTALGSKYADDPILGIVENLGLSNGPTEILRYYVGVLAAVILLIATNAGLIGVSRLTYSMGQHRQLPEGLRQVHPKYRTPYIAILIFAGIAILTLIPGKTDFLATLYSFGAMLSFTIAHVAVIQLRRKYPRRGADLEAAAERPRLRLRGAADRGARRARHLRRLDRGDGAEPVDPLRRHRLDDPRDRRLRPLPPQPGAAADPTVKVVTPEPLGVEEVEYRSVLVGFEDDEAFSPEMVATAVKLASKRRRGIHVHSMMTVPTNLPLDADLPEAEAEAQRRVEEAKLIGGARVTGHVARVRPGPGGLLDRRGGGGDQGGGDRHRPPLPQRRAAVRQDPADGPRRAPLPGDRRLRPAPDKAPLRPRRGARRGDAVNRDRAYHGAIRGFSLVFVVLGLLLLVVTLVNGGGPASIGFLMGILFVAVGIGPLLDREQAGADEGPGRRPARANCAARPRRALALRRRLLGGRLLDLLRPRRRRRARPRADAADLPRRRPALRPDDALLRRGLRRCSASAAAPPPSPATPSTSWSPSSPAGRSCSTT